MAIRDSHRRRIAWSIAILALVVIGGLLWSRLGPREELRPETDRQASGIGQAGGPGAHRDRLGSGESTRTELTPPAQPPPSSPFGTLVVLDEFDVPHPAEDGTMVVRASGKPLAEYQLQVQDGRWDPSALPMAQGNIVRILAGGKEALLVPEQSMVLAKGEPRELVCRWLASAMLHVVDDVSGRELDGVRLYSMDLILDEGVEFPIGVQGTRMIGESLASPVRIDPPPVERGPFSLFACAPGHAWGKLPFDRTGGGDAFLRLSPGADLRVSLSGGTPSLDTTVRLWRGRAGTGQLLAERIAVQLAADDYRCVFFGLPFGDYEVALERGARQSSTVLSRKSLRVEATGELAAQLVVPSESVNEFAQVSIHVTVDDSWGIQNLDLSVTDLDRPALDPKRIVRVRAKAMEQVDEHRFVSKPLQLRCGRHEIYFDAANFGVDAEITQETRDVFVVLPPRGLLRITVVDAATSEPIFEANACYQAVKSSGKTSGVGCVGIPAVAPGRLEFYAPQGKIQLSVDAGSIAKYLGDYRTVEVQAGVQDLLIRLSTGCVFSFVLREGERTLEGPPNFSRFVEFRLGGERVHPRRSALASTGRMSYFLADAGHYSISFQEIPGYMPIEPFELDLVPDAPFEHVISLVRRQ